MEAYTDFAYLYDTFMEDVPYEDWADLLSSLLKAYGENVQKVLDLGCGTGTLTELLSKKGYELTGVDYSLDMLSVAQNKSYESGSDILYINQDMRELSLVDKQDAIVCVCDCINYILLEDEIVECFLRVKDNLKPGGIFIFDFNTVYKYETVIGDATIAESREDCSFIWENYYEPSTHINEYDVTFFVREDGMDEDIFRRFEESHIQRGYDLSEMKEFIERAGLKFVTAIDEGTRKTPLDESERIYIIARK